MTEDRICSYCDKNGHKTDQCRQNPHRDNKSNYCVKIGHVEANCWSKQGISPVRLVQTDVQRSGSAIKLAKSNYEKTRIEMKEINQEIVTAAKSDADGQSISKQQHTKRELIQIPSLLNPELTEKEKSR